MIGDEQIPPDLERIIEDDATRKSVLYLFGHLQADEIAMVALKGHLVIEEKMTASIDKFVFHADELEDARLTFAQKLSICRSISADNQKCSIWNVIAKINKLRNTLSHSLDGVARTKAMTALRAAYMNECRMLAPLEEFGDAAMVVEATALCLGFLGGLENEIERFKSYVDALDRTLNPHRHTNPDSSSL
jgi:hypothetical protein